MKNIYKLGLSIFLLFCSTLMNAQAFQGKAVYLYFNNYSDVDWGKKNMSDADIAMWKGKLSQESQTSFELLFTLNESNWTEVASLSVEGGKGNSTQWGKPLNKLYYKNFEDQTYMIEAELFDKAFLVKDVLETPSWELTNETKTIGKYSATKAIWQVVEEVKAFGSEETESVTKEIVAWYTSEIPIPQGPERYWGLPGLILEIQNGPITYICEQVTLNPSEPIKLRIPKKGELVRQKELEAIAAEKMEEVLLKYNKTGKGKG